MIELDPIYNPKNGPKKHHYIPQFYLRQFVNEDDRFCVYDRETNMFHKSQLPVNWFFINHLYSFRPEGKTLFSLEKAILDPHDGEAASYFLKIRNTDNSPTLTDKVAIIHFIMNMYWRLPASDQVFRELIQKNGLNSAVFGIYDGEKERYFHEEEIDFIKYQMIEDIHTLRQFKHLVANSIEAASEAAELSQLWSLSNPKPDGEPFIIGDNPIIRNNPDLRYDQVFGELIVPISKYQALCLTHSMNEYLFAESVNLTIVHQSRFVASNNEMYLKELIGRYLKMSYRSQGILGKQLFTY